MSGLLGKRKWPDMRSLRWPPEGAASAARPNPAALPAPGAQPGGAPAPFELAPDPLGSGRLVAVPVTPPPRPADDPDLLYPPQPHPPQSPAGAAAPAPSPEAPMPAEAAPPAAASADAGREPSLAEVLAELRALRRTVDELTALVRAPAAAAEAPPASPPAPRPLSDPQARQEIEEYFHRHPGETIYPHLLAEQLGLPVLKVAELCERIAIQGRISRLP